LIEQNRLDLLEGAQVVSSWDCLLDGETLTQLDFLGSLDLAGGAQEGVAEVVVEEEDPEEVALKIEIEELERELESLLESDEQLTDIELDTHISHTEQDLVCLQNTISTLDADL